MRVLTYTNSVVGIWLILSPFIFGYAGNVAALWNSEVIGLLLLIVGVVEWAVPKRHHPDVDETGPERRRRAS